MAVELLNTVSIVSLAYLAGTLVVSYLLALLIGRKVFLIDRLVLWWIIWDGVVHLTLVCDNLHYIFSYDTLLKYKMHCSHGIYYSSLFTIYGRQKTYTNKQTDR